MDTKAPPDRIRVRNRDVLPHAKPKCKWCYGGGEVWKLVDGTRTPILCGCALRAFTKAQRTVADFVGRLYFAEPYLLLTEGTKAEHEAEKAARELARADAVKALEKTQEAAP